MQEALVEEKDCRRAGSLDTAFEVLEEMGEEALPRLASRNCWPLLRKPSPHVLMAVVVARAVKDEDSLLSH